MNWPFEIKDGSMLKKDSFGADFNRYVKCMKDGMYILENPKERKKTRSQKQRKYQWGCVYKILADHTGYDANEMHQEMGKQFLSYAMVDGDLIGFGSREQVREMVAEGVKIFTFSTTKLNTKEMEVYLGQVRDFAVTEFQDDDGRGLYIGLPNEPDNFYYDV